MLKYITLSSLVNWGLGRGVFVTGTLSPADRWKDILWSKRYHIRIKKVHVRKFYSIKCNCMYVGKFKASANFTVFEKLLHVWLNPNMTGVR